MSSREMNDSGGFSRGNSRRFGIERLIVILGVLLLAGPLAAQAQTKDDRGAPTTNSGTLTSVQLVHYYLDRIAALDPGVNAIIQLNPDAIGIAMMADRMRGHVSLAKNSVGLSGNSSTGGWAVNCV